MSGFSAVAEAIALPAAPIPKPAPKDAAPIVRPAANIRVPPSIVVRAGIAKIDKRHHKTVDGKRLCQNRGDECLQHYFGSFNTRPSDGRSGNADPQACTNRG